MTTTVGIGCSMEDDNTRRVQRRTLVVLALAQIVGGVGNGAGLTVASLLIREVSGSTRWAGLAVVMVTLGASVLSIPLARRAGARGRRAALALGWSLGSAGSATTLVGAVTGLLPLLLLGLGLFGAGTATNLQARFAAVDLAPPDRVGRSMALVTGATAVGAVAGPNVAGPAAELARALALPDAAGSVLVSAVALAIAGVITFAALRPDPLHVAGGRRPLVRRPRPALTAASRTGLITVCAANGTTGLVMAVSPIQMQDNGWSLQIVGLIMGVHFAGMFGSAPVMGALVDRFGPVRTLLGGQALVAASLCASAIADGRLPLFVLGLFLLGLGWSATSIAGSALLVRDVAVLDRPPVQGLGDMSMTLSSAGAASVSGFVFTAFGFATVNVAAGAFVLTVLTALVRYAILCPPQIDEEAQVRWTRDDVVAAGLVLLERDGLDALSLRGVARELGAHLNSVNWHVKTKHGLIALMADAIVGSVSLQELPKDPLERVAELIARYRGALLARRDGGRLVAGTFTAGGGTLRVAEALVEGLLAAGYGPEAAARECWALVYFTLGLTQEEQTRPDTPGPAVPAAIDSGRYPAMAQVGAHLLIADSFDARFDYGIGRLLMLDIAARPV